MVILLDGGDDGNNSNHRDDYDKQSGVLWAVADLSSRPRFFLTFFLSISRAPRASNDDDDDDDDCQMFLSSLAGKRLLQKRAIEVCTKTSIFSW